MKARGLSVVTMAATLLGAAVAVAQESDPAEPDATPSGNEPPPEDSSPPEYPPPVAAAPTPPPAAAPADDTHFGFAGQITISDDLEMAATRTSVEGSSASLTQIQLRPALDFFVIPNLSIGGQLIIGYNSLDDSGSSSSSSELGLLLRVGYNVAISDTTSIWPRVSLGYDHIGGVLDGNPGNRVPFDVFVPIVVQPAPHFFLGGGPMFSTTLFSEQEGVDQARMTTIGLRATVGGYFRGM